MTLTQITQEVWTTADLELLPESTSRYEIINGELLVTRAPNWRHQSVCDAICTELRIWSQRSGLGRAISGVGIIFADTDNVIPDVIWISNERLAISEDSNGHFTSAPELVIEVISMGGERRDRDLKLKLYSTQGVREYWIIDRFLQQVQVYQRMEGRLALITTCLSTEMLTSQLLPNFTCIVSHLFD